MTRWLVIPIALLAACGNGSGGRCSASTGCQGGLVCVSTSPPGTDGGPGDVRLCMRLCDHDGGDGVAQHLCSDGTACLALDGMSVCYLGGSHPIRGGCASDTECEPGTVCAPDTMLCAQACTVGTNRPCAMGETCVATGGGICRAVATVLDAGP